jgi:hypothetical protein
MLRIPQSGLDDAVLGERRAAGAPKVGFQTASVIRYSLV